MFNKFELFGIGISVLLMALALFLLQLDTSFLTSTNNKTQLASTVGGVVAVNKDTPDEKVALRDAILSAADPDGKLQKLIIDDVLIGNGTAVESGNTVTVNYIGTLQNGEEFDNSFKRGTPFTFTIGDGKVIKGWEEGIVGMKLGGKRILVIPSDMGYGAKGYGPIPKGATLVFAIDLIEIK